MLATQTAQAAGGAECSVWASRALRDQLWESRESKRQAHSSILWSVFLPASHCLYSLLPLRLSLQVLLVLCGHYRVWSE